MRISVLTLLVALAGCQTIPAPVVKPFADSSNWVLVEPLEYRLLDSEHVIRVPAGFVTDFASVPRLAWTVMSPFDRHGRAAVVHDWLYWTQACTREQSDKIMLLGMIESGVPNVKRVAIHTALRLAGSVAWNHNAAERAKGLPRIVSGSEISPPAEAIWPLYRQSLWDSGARVTAEEMYAAAPAYCSAIDGMVDGTDLAKQKR